MPVRSEKGLDRDGLIKVCGLTHPADARAALAAGADLAGLIFSDSPRRVVAREIKEWVASLRSEFPRAAWVGVFLPEDRNMIPSVLEELKLDLIQCHGAPLPPEVYQYGLPVMPCLRIGGKRPAPPDEESGAWALLLDTYDPDRAGGTGRPFPWEWIEGWSRQRRIILSGGLGPDNVGPAIHAVQPQGVDASSRLERGQGRKDLDAVRAYIEKARHAFNELGGRPSGK